MAKKTIHHLGFETIVEMNKKIVSLTGEPHGFSLADSQKLLGVVKEVEQRADNEDPKEAIPEKAALLVFKLASGQYFRSGNRRTALMAALVFLAKNGYKIDIADPDLLSTVDRVGVAAASLDDIYEILNRLAVKSKAERSGWDKVVEQAVDSQKDFLREQGR